MQIKLTNSLTKSKEIFKPLAENIVKMYVCGPTVYDRAHLGNARSAVVYDLLFRLLRECFEQVVYVRNITDVDDKIIIAAREQQIPIDEITKQMTAYYHEDMAALNCLEPTFEPRATAHITEMIVMIQTLIDSGHAYVAEGHVLFDISSYEQYGNLAKRSIDSMIAGSRVEVAPFKRNPMDFVLWKPSLPDEVKASFPSPWGHGRPGWHIECSAMSAKYLGSEFDIHGGGADLMFPHHENEIAQSCSAHRTNKMASFWVHNGFLTVNGEKMSKSLGNFKTLREVIDTGISGWIIRFFYLTAHYRKPLDLNAKSFIDANKALQKFTAALGDFNFDSPLIKDEELLSILADDMNTPKFIAKLYELAANGEKERLWYGLNLLGLEKFPNIITIIPEEIHTLARKRQIAKSNKDWGEADRLREKIEAAGFVIVDLPQNGYNLKAKNKHNV
jgi:cysteinyl-tRNA synthetase